jgi:hypothetical protein
MPLAATKQHTLQRRSQKPSFLPRSGEAFLCAMESGSGYALVGLKASRFLFSSNVGDFTAASAATPCPGS